MEGQLHKNVKNLFRWKGIAVRGPERGELIQMTK